MMAKLVRNRWCCFWTVGFDDALTVETDRESVNVEEEVLAMRD